MARSGSLDPILPNADKTLAGLLDYFSDIKNDPNRIWETVGDSAAIVNPESAEDRNKWSQTASV